MNIDILGETASVSCTSEASCAAVDNKGDDDQIRKRMGKLSTIDLSGGLASSALLIDVLRGRGQVGQSVTYAPNAKGEAKWSKPLAIAGVEA